MDLALMEERDLQDILPYAESDLVREHIRLRFASPGLNFALRHHGQLVACGGIQRMWPGVGEAWFWGTPLKRRHGLSVWLAARRWLKASMTLLRLHRVELIVRYDFTEAHRFARVLGFTVEGVKSQHGPDRSDYTMYARVTQKEEPSGR